MRSALWAVLMLGTAMAKGRAAIAEVPPNYAFVDIAAANGCFDQADATVGTAFGINENGRAVVGQATNACVGGFPARSYKRFLNAGTMVDAGTLGGDESAIWAIIDSNRAVGWADTFGPPTVQWPRPAIFQPQGGTPTNLPTVGGAAGDEGVAFDIDASSRIVGASQNQQDIFRASYWQESSPGVWAVTDLGTLPGGVQRAVIWQPSGPGAWTITQLPNLTPGADSVAFDVTNAVVVVGWSETPAGERRAARWEFLGGQWQVTNLGTLGGNSSEAHAVNGTGDIVGTARTGGVGTDHAVVWPAVGVIHDLHSRLCRYLDVDQTDNWILREAWDINEAGHIVGWGVRDSGSPPQPRQRPFLLQPIPCNGDVNGDGVVDIDDLLILLGDWNEACGPSDINNDGVVSILDFLNLLADWACGDATPEPFPADAQQCIGRYWPDVNRVAACITALNFNGP